MKYAIGAKCACGGPIRITREQVYQDHAHSGFDNNLQYLAKCLTCGKQKFGYTEFHAVKRLQEGDE